jgi:hypothetical protein
MVYYYGNYRNATQYINPIKATAGSRVHALNRTQVE